MTAGTGALWGIAATVRAPRREILQFCAFHLSAGAARIHVFLDDPASDAFDALQAHPRVRVERCSAGYWKRLCGARPEMHQHRQRRNANRAYRNATGLDWLIHMDVDELLVPADPDSRVSGILSALGPDVFCARVRPMEVLAGAPALFKRPVPRGADHDRIMARLYPQWGGFVKAGFLSHVVGKLFVRTGHSNARIRIHNVLVDGVQNPGLTELADLDLAHLHAPSAESFLAHYRYRLQAGSYRAGLGPNRPREAGGITMHELLTAIEQDSGEDGLRTFFAEVAEARPALVAGLRDAGLLREVDLQLEDALTAEFPTEV